MSSAGLAPRGAREAADRLDWGREGLAGWQKRIARAAVEAMLCDEDASGDLAPPSPDVCERGVSWMSLSLGASSSYLRLSFMLLTIALDILPLFVVGSPRRMSRMSLAERVTYLEALDASRISVLPMLLLAFKVTLCMPAFEEGDELVSIGFDRPSISARRKLPAGASGGAP